MDRFEKMKREIANAKVHFAPTVKDSPACGARKYRKLTNKKHLVDCRKCMRLM